MRVAGKPGVLSRSGAGPPGQHRGQASWGSQPESGRRGRFVHRNIVTRAMRAELAGELA